MPVIEKSLSEHIISSRGRAGTYYTRIIAIKETKVEAEYTAEEYLKYRPHDTVYFCEGAYNSYVWKDEGSHDEPELPGSMAQRTL